MNIWIVTIGSSDVQLDSDNENRKKDRTEKQRSDKVWHYWYGDEFKADYYDITFEPKRPYKEREESYRIEPRILGSVYESSSSEIQNEIWKYLIFPLLDNFVGELNASPPDAIAVLLTDQSGIFKNDHQRKKQKCPYWQDTCKLEPILKQYFQNRFPKIEAKYIEYITLTPTSSSKGLDNWDYVLDLVDDKLRNLHINGEALKVKPNETVYVSHQAGTPALSSAVQFVSLAQFEKTVRFLVSNEYDSSLTEVVPSSKYLRKIQQEKAKQLLARHDYFGVKELFGSYLESEAKELLEAAIKWNRAEFEKFSYELKNCSNQNLKQEVQERTKEENWWWSAYESAYLAVVRLKQKNTVEAMFHSFRAVEGVIGNWSKQKYPGDIEDRKGKPVAILRSPSNLPQYLIDKLKEIENGEMALYGESLFKLLRESKPELKEHNDVKVIWKSAKSKRNDQFHQLLGLDEKEVFQAWGMNSQRSWETRLLNCLNLITNQSHFKSIQKASLMSKVHNELEKAIAQYELSA